MSDSSLIVHSLGKKYSAGPRSAGRGLRHCINHFVQHPWRSLRPGETSDFWALRNVSFEIRQGEVAGVIGRNGAGKSTLLKILSRITRPSEGEARLRGRVASLLEVGTGFHPELSGRENIYLNGALLGMMRSEIKQQFDAIVSFAEVERFIDMPVKRYSSGMYVRLAFAVAAHLRAEILILDEVLAVGDLQFQKKCLGAMSAAARDGRTVLLVSHNMEVIRQLCPRVLLLDKSQLVKDGPAWEVLQAYMHIGENQPARFPVDGADSNAPVQAEWIEVQDMAGKAAATLPAGTPWQVKVRLKVHAPIDELVVGLGLCAWGETPVQTTWSRPLNLSPGSYDGVFHQHTLQFAPGHYTLTVGLSRQRRVLQYVEKAGAFQVADFSEDLNLPAISGIGLVLNQKQFSLRTAGVPGCGL